MPPSSRHRDKQTFEHRPTGNVDLSLIDIALRMSPEDRLVHNDRMVTMAEELRAGFKVKKDHG